MDKMKKYKHKTGLRWDVVLFLCFILIFLSCLFTSSSNANEHKNICVLFVGSVVAINVIQTFTGGVILM